MKVVGYCRFSAEAQKDGYSIDAQKRAIREYCKKEGLDLLEFYIDEARTGTNDKRPNFQRMMDDVSKGIFDAIIVHKRDRFSRNKFDFALYGQRLNDFNIKLLSVTECNDDTPENDILTSMLEAFAAYYPKNLSREVRKGMDEAARMGMATGGAPSFGYITDPKTRKYVIVESEAEIVRKIYDWFLSGLKINDIVVELEKNGVKTKRGNPMKAKAVMRILTSEKYLGTTIFNSYHDYSGKRALTPKSDLIKVEDSFPAIIDKDTFLQVQKIIDSGRRGHYARRTKEDYILSGYVYCGECGSKMKGSASTKSTKDGKQLYKYYVCPNKAKKTCHIKQIQKRELENAVMKIIDERLFQGETLNLIINEIYSAMKEYGSLPEEKVLEYKKTIAATSTKLDRLLNLYLDGDMDKEVYKKKKAELTAFKQMYEDELNKSLLLGNISKEEIRAKLLYFAAKLLSDNKNLERKKAAIAALIDRIDLYDDKVVVTFKFNVTASKVQNGDPYGIRTHECIRERDVS